MSLIFVFLFVCLFPVRCVSFSFPARPVFNKLELSSPTHYRQTRIQATSNDTGPQSITDHHAQDMKGFFPIVRTN